jgi:hypothetical protein
LRVAGRVVYFLANQQQDALIPVTVVIFRTVDQHIVVGHNDCVQARLQGGAGDLGVGIVPIRVGGVHVEVDDDLIH